MEMSYRGRRRSRRRMILAPIQSFKQQRQEAVTYAGSLANNNYIVAVGTLQDAMGGDRKNVPVGANISSVHVTVNFGNTSAAATGDGNWMLTCLRAGQDIQDEFAATNAADWTNIGLSNARNQVIKSFLVNFGTENGSTYRYSQQIKIPKVYQRIRQGDVWTVTWTSGLGGQLLIGTRYKYYT